MRRLAIVIVNWNTRDLLRRCIASLGPLKGEARIILVDNASSDGSVQAVREQFPNVCVIQNETNEGYSKANNRGWRASAEDFVLLLNSDTLPDPAAIRDLLAFMESHPEAGVVGPFLSNEEGKPQVGAAGWDLTIRSGMAYQFFLNRLSSNLSKPFYLHQPLYAGSEPVEVGWVSGAAMMTTRKALESVGGLPEKFFMYAEDVDYCRLVNAAGLKVYYLPSIEIIHIHGGSSKANDLSVPWLDSTLRYYQGLHGRWKGRSMGFLFALGAVLRMIASVLLRPPDPRNPDATIRRYWAVVRASIRAGNAPLK